MQARQLREERARGAGLQRGLAKAVYTAERERAVARVAAAKEMYGLSLYVVPLAQSLSLRMSWPLWCMLCSIWDCDGDITPHAALLFKDPRSKVEHGSS